MKSIMSVQRGIRLRIFLTDSIRFKRTAVSLLERTVTTQLLQASKRQLPRNFNQFGVLTAKL